MITGSIDVVKINRDRLVAGRKGGKYLNIVLIETPNSEYGDYMICESVSREERAKGIKGAILGNAKRFDRTGGPRRPQPEPKQEINTGEDDVPF